MHTILLHTKPALDRSGHTLGTLAVSDYESGALVYQGREAESKLCDSWDLLRPVQRISCVAGRTCPHKTLLLEINHPSTFHL
jgi:hypothetical protein